MLVTLFTRIFFICIIVGYALNIYFYSYNHYTRVRVVVDDNECVYTRLTQRLPSCAVDTSGLISPGTSSHGLRADHQVYTRDLFDT